MEFFLISDEGHAEYKANMGRIEAAEIKAQGSREEEDLSLHLLSVENSVARITVQGAMLSKGNWWSQLFSVPAYTDIRNALVTAAQDPSVKSILMDLDTPGGPARGLEDVTNLMKQVRKVKPIYAHTSARMGSAGMWIGAAADQVFATRMAEVGDIGVLMVHFDETKALEDMGVKPTVLRSTPLKGAGSSLEALDPEFQALMEKNLATMHAEFVRHLAEERKVSIDTVANKWALGRTFFGFEAKQMGIIDGIMSIDNLFQRMVKAH